ncbi:IclR family transcriptional regulator [Microbispora sp. H13382]|uniref:IclR family transcriptional regulator n=1 Tax=Microbispora sp. H13382 TaxID=2729112 RepID=UPI001604125A|nr:IclR family transcriptional regulator [Microbispora sp. H13382]
MKNRPDYAVSSVDHALRLALLLQQEGPMRSSELASRLKIARSTAHRLLAMLVYRGFAQQNEDRRYDAGPALRPIGLNSTQVAELRAFAMPHLQTLRDTTGETVNLQVLSGLHVRFIACVESTHLLKVGDREGQLFPAWDISGGRVLLAALPPEELVERLTAEPEFDPSQLDSLLKILDMVRRRGFAINDQHKRTERGVTAVARAVRQPNEEVIAAMSLAMPTSRFRRDQLSRLNAEIASTVAAVERDLRGSPRSGLPQRADAE